MKTAQTAIKAALVVALMSNTAPAHAGILHRLAKTTGQVGNAFTWVCARPIYYGAWFVSAMINEGANGGEEAYREIAEHGLW